jgi:hypothetical protein
MTSPAHGRRSSTRCAKHAIQKNYKIATSSASGWRRAERPADCSSSPRVLRSEQRIGVPEIVDKYPQDKALSVFMIGFVTP